MKLKLVKKIDEARGTKSFFWEPESPLAFKAGQYYYFTLPKLEFPDPRGTTRHFTISSSPTEGNLIRLTTRIRQESGFKKTLDELPIGSVIEGEGPNGTLTLKEEDAKTPSSQDVQVFVAGGIGITPFRSIIKYSTDKGLKIPMYLIYSNSDNDFAFKKELDEWQKENENIKVAYFDSSVSGHLDQLKIGKFIENWKLKIDNCVWWLVGPPAFTDAMETVLEKMKILSDHIRSEKFTGY